MFALRLPSQPDGRARALRAPAPTPPPRPPAPRAQDEWTATGGGGQAFDPVDLREDWADFDEKLKDSVSVMGLEAKFVLERKGK
jgi:hypothetical protein